MLPAVKQIKSATATQRIALALVDHKSERGMRLEASTVSSASRYQRDSLSEEVPVITYMCCAIETSKRVRSVENAQEHAEVW